MRQIKIPLEIRKKHLKYFKIEAPKNYDKLIYFSFLNEHINANYQSSNPAVLNLIRTCGTDVFKYLIDFLYKHFNNIVNGSPKYIYAIEEEFYNELYSKYAITEETRPLIDEILKLIFDYDSFVKTKNKFWSPIILTKELAINICPYCNNHFTFTQLYNSKTRKFQIRPDLDHFFTQHSHPMLSISLYNLVPSCSICNSKLKHMRDSSLEKGVHPFIEDANSIFYFRRKITSSKYSSSKKDIDLYSTIMGLDTNYNFEIVPINSIHNEKVLEFEKMYQLTKRYEPYKDIINQSIKRTLLYSHNYLKSLDSAYTFFDFAKYTGSNLENIDENILSKVKNDILVKEILPKMNPK